MKMRLLCTATAVLLSLSAPALACGYYAARLDLEGKLGNKRDIGESSLFLPVACTQDRLLFSDIRFRADDRSNREGNLGLGARVLQEQGIAGGYVYFDRKKSGETDKYYNQITAGAEWLAQTWEVRGNAYIPVTGTKTIGAGTVTSAPYLAGSGIFVDSSGFLLKEKPLYGADIEAGVKIPDTKLWIYGGGFGFHADDVPNVSGVRGRARYDLTETVSLTAEGQYDGERGRQGWVGARWSIPFGAKVQSQGLQARMTQSPVRDIDVVTQAQVTSTPKATTSVLNTDSGIAQRVIYVDNRAAAGGDGTLEKPFDTLAGAQAVLADYDVVYVHHGDGTTTGMNQGFVIDKSNVSFIGEGSAFVYDGGKFSAQNGADYSGYLLKAAGSKPVITNGAGHGINVTGESSTISGLRVEGALSAGINVLDSPGGGGGFTRVTNIDANNNGTQGIIISVRDASGASRVYVDAISATGNQRQGFALVAESGGHIEQADVSRVTVTGSVTTLGFFIAAGTSTGVGTIDNLTIDDVLTTAMASNEGVHVRSRGAGSLVSNLKANNVRSVNNGIGILISAENGGRMEDIVFTDLLATLNSAAGVRLTVNTTSVVDNIRFTGLKVTDNVNMGLEISRTNDDNSVSRMVVENSDIMRNGRSGVRFNDDGGASGGLYATIGRGNRIAGNGTQNFSSWGDVMLDLNGGSVDVSGNWWGQGTGPAAGQIRNEGAGPNTGTAIVDDFLAVDPRP